MALYRTKPGAVRYFEAVKDENTGTYFAKEIDRNGKGIGPVSEIAAADFERDYEQAQRLPTNKPAPKQGESGSGGGKA